ncbi:hypothetical protein SALBM311S_13097 [Streptomyces alboniger]
MYTDSCIIPFEGPREVTAQLTWGQRYFWDLIAATPADKKANVNIPMIVPITTESSADDVLIAISRLMAKHDSLRTKYQISSDGEPRQVVFAVGELSVYLVESGGDPQETASALCDAMRAGESDSATTGHSELLSSRVIPGLCT